MSQNVTPDGILNHVLESLLLHNLSVRFRRNVDAKAPENVDKRLELGLFMNRQGSAVNGRKKHGNLSDTLEVYFEDFYYHAGYFSTSLIKLGSSN